MAFQDDLFFTDNTYGDLYLVVNKEPDIVICTFLDSNKILHKIYIDDRDLDFYVEIYDDFPLYKKYKIYTFNGGYYVKIPLGLDEEADKLFIEHFEGYSFLMSEIVQKYPEKNLLYDLGELVSVDYPDKHKYIGGKRVADKKQPISNRGKKPEKWFEFTRTNVPTQYFLLDEISFVNVGKQRLDF